MIRKSSEAIMGMAHFGIIEKVVFYSHARKWVYARAPLPIRSRAVSVCWGVSLSFFPYLSDFEESN